MTRSTMTLPLALAAATWMVACGSISENPAGPDGNPGDVTLPEAPEAPGADEPEAPGADRALSQAQRDALVAALGDVELLSGMLPGMGDVDEIGTLTVTTNVDNPAPVTTGTTTGAASMDAVAYQLSITDGSDTFTETAVIAWDGLDEKAGTVDELLVVFAPDLLDVGSADIGSIISFNGPAKGPFVPTGFALQIDNVNGTSLISESGTLDIDVLTLDPAVACDVLPPKAATCTEADGDLEGSLDMDAYEFPVDGGVISIDFDPATEPLVTFTADFDVPVTRTTITY